MKQNIEQNSSGRAEAAFSEDSAKSKQKTVLSKGSLYEAGQAALLSCLPRPLLSWYDTVKRDLPWRENTDPYRVWVSEIMLQQTRVEAVKEGYVRFMQALPDLKSLAQAPEELLMKLWEGMGYYSRARNLQKAAKLALETWGELPGSVEKLRSLPGIGEYTAGAVASIAFGISAPAVDGNVLRVLSRVLNFPGDITSPSVKKEAGALLSPIIPQDRPGDFTQALMELGALTCVPGSPRCDSCPISRFCEGFKAGTASRLPAKKEKKARKKEERTVFLLLDETGYLALERRPQKGLLAGMWQLPNVEGFFSPEEGERFWAKKGFTVLRTAALPRAVHVFSHIEWHMQGMALFLKGIEPQKGKTEDPSRDRGGIQPLVWASLKDLQKEKALPSAFRVYRSAFERIAAGEDPTEESCQLTFPV